MSLADYRDTVLARFANPAVKDQLAAHHLRRRLEDPGLPRRDDLRACLERGGDQRRLAFLFAAFAHYLGGRDDRGAAFTPLEPHLTAADRSGAGG